MAFNNNIAVTTPLIGPNVQAVEKPKAAVGSASDPLANFKLGSMVTGPNGKLYQYARCAANINNGATCSIVNGVTNGAATATSTWTNDTGVNAVTGDYVWFDAAGPVAG